MHDRVLQLEARLKEADARPKSGSSADEVERLAQMLNSSELSRAKAERELEALQKARVEEREALRVAENLIQDVSETEARYHTVMAENDSLRRRLNQLTADRAE